MTSLQDTIENFHAYIIEHNKKIQKEIAGPNLAFKKMRLAVYSDGYFLRLLEILANDFPAVKKIMGDDLFEELCGAYLAYYPSHSFSVRHIGAQLEKFLKEDAGIAIFANTNIDSLMLVEMARFEWALESATVAKDGDQLTFAEVSIIAPEQWDSLKLSTHPSLVIHDFHYSIPAFWQHLLQTHPEKPILVPQEKQTHWLIWRFNRQSYFRSVDDLQLKMIHLIQSEKDFSQICEALCEHMDEEKIILFVAKSLRVWIEEGIFSSFSVLD